LSINTVIMIEDAPSQLAEDVIVVKDESGASYNFMNTLTDSEKEMILAGGKINALRNESGVR